jgi:hypothetical protein
MNLHVQCTLCRFFVAIYSKGYANILLNNQEAGENGKIMNSMSCRSQQMIIHTTDPTKRRPAGVADCRSADIENLLLLRELNFIFVFTKDRHCAFS